MTILQILRAIWSRKAIVLWIFAGVLTAGTLVSLLLPRQYVATSAVLIDMKNADPVTGNVLPAAIFNGFISTQVDVIRSKNVALRVVDNLRLSESPVIRQRFEQDTEGNGSFRDWCADLLLHNLDVIPARDSSVITIAFSGRDPGFVASVANAFADSYIQASLELRRDPAIRQSIWFEDQLQGMRKRLEDAQHHLAAYQRENNLVSIDPNRIDIENSRLAEISNQLVTAQGTQYDALSKLAQLKDMKGQSRLMQLPDLLGNTLLQSMKADLVRAEGKLAELGQRYDRNHPAYVAAAAEVSALKGKLSGEIATARGSIEQTAKLSERHVQELQHALNAQKQNILELQKQRDQQAVLMREVENAQQVYDEGLRRSSAVRLESELTQGNVAVLNSAVPPTRPAKPRVALNIVLSALAGAMFGTVAAILLEIADRRVRARADLDELCGIRVLAELPAPPRRRRGGHFQLKPA